MSGRPNIPVLPEAGRALDEASIGRFEQEIGRRIPAQYREFLLRTNGGRPDKRVFRFTERDGFRGGSVVRGFLGIGAPGEYDLRYFFRVYVNKDRIPHDLFPISDDEGGNLVLIGGPGPREGQVFFWDHDWEAEEGDPPTEENIHFIAGSLDDFLANLEPDREPLSPRR